MFASFLGKMVGVKVVVGLEKRQENGDLWNPSLKLRYLGILQEELLLLSVKISSLIIYIEICGFSGVIKY